MTVAHFEKLVLDCVVRYKLTDIAVREVFKLCSLKLGPSKIEKFNYGLEVLNFREQLTKVIERNEDVLSKEITLSFVMNTNGATPFHSSKKVFRPF